MIRRTMLGVLSAAAAGVAAGVAEAAGPPDEKEDIHTRCAEACVDCSKHCNMAFHHCYKQVQAGKVEHAKLMHMFADCSEVCATSGALVARMSPLMVHTCDACGDCCADTIAAIEKVGDLSSPEMKGVVAALKTCHGTCEEMVKSMGKHTHP